MENLIFYLPITKLVHKTGIYPFPLLVKEREAKHTGRKTYMLRDHKREKERKTVKSAYR